MEMKLRFPDLNLHTLNKKYRLNLSDRRIRHMEGAAKLAAKLCELHNLKNSDKYVKMAYYHDIARDIPEEKYNFFSNKSDYLLENEEVEKYVLKHAPLGAFLVLEYRLFNRVDQSYINAIRWHTLGKDDSFEYKFLKICDFAEYTREFPSAETIRKIAFNDIEKAYKKLKELKINYWNKMNER